MSTVTLVLLISFYLMPSVSDGSDGNKKSSIMTNITYSLITPAPLFFPYQCPLQLGPKTTGTTFFDDLQKPASFVLTSKDPSGFSKSHQEGAKR
jgi:hypothetical protein